MRIAQRDSTHSEIDLGSRRGSVIVERLSSEDDGGASSGSGV
jgi:hypothetical protein